MPISQRNLVHGHFLGGVYILRKPQPAPGQYRFPLRALLLHAPAVAHDPTKPDSSTTLVVFRALNSDKVRLLSTMNFTKIYRREGPLQVTVKRWEEIMPKKTANTTSKTSK